MQRLKTFAAAVMIAVTAATGSLVTATPADARDRHRHHRGDVAAGAALGLLGGVILGGALAGPRYSYGAPTYGYGPVYAPPPVYYRRAPRYLPPPVYAVPRHYGERRVYRTPRYVERRYGARSAHVDWCRSRYRSYRAADNSWVDYSGRIRNCRSPYGS